MVHQNSMFTFTAESGGMKFADITQQKFFEHMQNHEGSQYDIIPRKKRRTVSQNSYLHVLFDYISQETGHSRGEVKTTEKRRHLKPKEIEMFGEKSLVLPSTTELSNLEMSEFIERVLADCSFLNIHVPTSATVSLPQTHSHKYLLALET